MNVIKTKIDGVLIIEPDIFIDERGIFVKPFSEQIFSQLGIHSEYAESFFSISKKNVIRGMHFQSPPQDHAKLIYVPHGAILDVVVDIRKSSPTYGQYVSVELNDTNRSMIYIPHGCAHGFLSLADDSCTTYLQSTIQSKEHEGGIRFDSFGFDWNVSNPIISKRDLGFMPLEQFDSPFIANKKDL